MGRVIPLRMGVLVVAQVVVTAPILAQTPSGSELKVTTTFANAVRSDESIGLHLNRPLLPTAGRLAVFIGHTDWSALFESTDRGVIYRPAIVKLPAGEHDVPVYFVSSLDQWQAIGHFKLRVIATGRSSQADVVPRLDIANKSQVAEGHHPTSAAPPRSTFQDFTLKGGLRTSTVRGGWTTQGQINLLGVTNQREAIRFQLEGEAAPLTDLVDYKVGVENHRGAFTLGHVTFGANRHLFNSFASRGALVKVRFGPRSDLALAALNGSTIVGWSNFLGVEERTHRVAGATLGIEMLPRAGALRLETSLLDGRLLPVFNFNQARINDAEQSHGAGLRVLASDGKQRLRVDGGYARSTFTNPADPLLSQGTAVVPVENETRNARYVDVSYGLFREKPIGKTRKVNLLASYRHEQVDPLYGSVVAKLKSDVRQNGLALHGNIGALTAQVSHVRARDNLDEIASIVKTFTWITQVNAAMPLGAIARNNRKPRPWLPSLVYTLNRIHQRGAGVPPNSGISSTAQIPNQIATDQRLGVEWQRSRYRAAYRVNRTYQDNRQTGKEGSDFANLVQRITFDVTPASRVDLQMDLAFEGARNKELARTDLTRRIGLNAHWRLTSGTAISGLASTTLMENDVGTRKGRETDLNLELSQSVSLSWWASGRTRGQFFVRYVLRSSHRFDHTFTLDDSRRLWTFNTGFNLSLF